MERRRRPLVMVVVGARPNFVKVAPILRAMERDESMRALLVHTGQHYDRQMSDVFFEELQIRTQALNLAIGSGTSAEQTGAVMIALERLVGERQPDLMMTVGDVNSTLAAALVAAKAALPQAHVEAGLRAGDPRMPEEVNRVLVDRLADLLFTHSDEAVQNLLAEGVPAERIFAVGNVMIDTLNRMRPLWQGAARKAVPELPREYGVVTLHRGSNVDSAATLAARMAALSLVAAQVPLVFPVHPRTRKALDATLHKGIMLVEPLGYLAFLDLMEQARVVLTDSGGIQEETTILNVPCLTLRDTTERPVTVRLGSNRVVGTDGARIAAAASDVLSKPPPPKASPPMWDGHAAERLVIILADWLAGAKRLRLSS